MLKMAVSYNRLWKLPVDKKMSKAGLRCGADIASNTLKKLRKDEEVSLSILRRICEFLECNFGDICDFVIVEEPEVVSQ